MQSSPAGDLLSELAQVPDPRGLKGRRHCLSAMLTAVVCAFLSGARGYGAIAQWLHLRDVDDWHWMGFTRKPPTRNCFRDLLTALNPVAFEAILTRWVHSLDGVDVEQLDEDLQAVSLDGKALRGTISQHGRIVHLLSILDQQTGCVLSQSQVDDKTNEHKGALYFLKTIVLEGRVVVADAMFCHKDYCQRVRDGNGHYFVVVKENQPQLKRDIQSAFAETEGFSPLRPA